MPLPLNDAVGTGATLLGGAVSGGLPTLIAEEVANTLAKRVAPVASCGHDHVILWGCNQVGWVQECGVSHREALWLRSRLAAGQQLSGGSRPGLLSNTPGCRRCGIGSQPLLANTISYALLLLAS